MKRAFICGSYRADNLKETAKNILKAQEVAREYWKKGYFVMCPHMNSAFFDFDIKVSILGENTFSTYVTKQKKKISDKIFLKGYRNILHFFDAIILLPGWEKSEGSKDELEEALGLKLEIITEKEE